MMKEEVQRLEAYDPGIYNEFAVLSYHELAPGEVKPGQSRTVEIVFDTRINESLWIIEPNIPPREFGQPWDALRKYANKVDVTVGSPHFYLAVKQSWNPLDFGFYEFGDYGHFVQQITVKKD